MDCETLAPLKITPSSPGLETEEVVRLSKKVKAWTRYAATAGGVPVSEIYRTLRQRGDRFVAPRDLEQVLDAEYNRRDHGRGRLVLIRADWSRADAAALRQEKATTLWIANVREAPSGPAHGEDASARLLQRASKRLKGWTRREHQNRGLLVHEALKRWFHGEERRRVAFTRSLLRDVLDLEKRTQDRGRGRLAAVDAAGRHLDPAQLESCAADAIWIVNVWSLAASQRRVAAAAATYEPLPAGAPAPRATRPCAHASTTSDASATVRALRGISSVDARSSVDPSGCAHLREERADPERMIHDSPPPCAERQGGGVDAFEATAVFVQHEEDRQLGTRGAARCAVS